MSKLRGKMARGITRLKIRQLLRKPTFRELETIEEKLSIVETVHQGLCKIQETEGRFGKALGFVALVKNIISEVTPGYTTGILQEDGFDLVTRQAWVATLVYNSLEESTVDLIEVKKPSGKRFISPEGIVFVHEDNYIKSIWTPPDTDFSEKLRNYTWKDETALELLYEKKDNLGGSWALCAIPEVNEFIGDEITPEKIGQELEAKDSILLVGATGSRKSTFARLLADRKGRILKINGTSLLQLSGSFIEELLKIMKPDVLLLDDLQVFLKMKGEEEAGILEVIEKANENAKLVVGTIMTGPDKVLDIRNLTPGSLYFPGLRPGRFNKVIGLDLPPFEIRREIIKSYLKKPIMAETLDLLARESEDLSGAYLKQLATEIDKGIVSPELIIRRLKSAFPSQVTSKKNTSFMIETDDQDIAYTP